MLCRRHLPSRRRAVQNLCHHGHPQSPTGPLPPHCGAAEKCADLLLDTPPCEDRPPPVREEEVAQDDSEQWVSAIYVAQLLEHGKRHYSGVAKLGVEALELKIKGYSGADIARLYHTKPNHVGAWIARAAEKFRQDAISADLLSQMGFEKGA